MSASELRQQSSRPVRTRSLWIWSGVLVLALVLWGGYSGRMSWTGINGHTATLWDWLHLLMLPAAFALLPLTLSRRAGLTRRHKSRETAAVVAFAVLVLLGYVIPWAWTGFSGNRLWDWLHLLLLPLLLPTLIVPALIGVTAARLVIAEEERESDVAAGAEPDAPEAESPPPAAPEAPPPAASVSAPAPARDGR
jgi:hypothetical protein